MGRRSLSLVLLSCVIALASGDLQCYDEDNNPVDWYVMYKFPLIRFSSNPNIAEGKGYMYITSSALDKGWKPSDKPIDSNTTLLAHTLQFLNSKKQNVLWFIYNDQGNETCYDCGHTKGVIAGDKNGGLWLVHSIPHLLENVYPKTGLRYGQSAICVSLSRDMLNAVGDLLAYNTPKFQRWNIDNELKDLYPKILNAFKHVKVATPWTAEKILSSPQGTKFHSFAKAGPFNKDLYEWVATSLQTDLLTETWLNEGHVLPSSCSKKYRVMNVESLIISQLNLTYTTHKDHSKLAIANDAGNPWVCVGDINRAEPQKLRGGGTVCLNNKKLWESYRNLVKTTDTCSATIFPSVQEVNNGI